MILSNILGDGDMPVIWTLKFRNGKRCHRNADGYQIDGLTENILHKALAQARDGRLFIIGNYAKLSALPVRHSMCARGLQQLRLRKTRWTVIGSEVKYSSIISETGVTISGEDDGTVTIASADAEI